jgi:hypothetical protein
LFVARQSGGFQRRDRRRGVGVVSVGEAIVGLAAVAAVRGHLETGGSVRAAARACGCPPTQFDKLIDERLEREYFAAARARLGEVQWQRAQQATAGFSHEATVEYATVKVQELIRTATPSTQSRAPNADSDPREQPLCQAHRRLSTRPGGAATWRSGFAAEIDT